MAALATVQDYVTEARALLQDEIGGSYRYPDADILRALNIGLLEARRLRPELFFPFKDAIPTFVAVNTDPVAFDQQYRSALVYYIVGRMELRDSENDKDSRAGALLALFRAQLISAV